MPHRKLTKEKIAAMRAVKDGADVFNRALAVRLREIQRDYPEYITIVRAIGGDCNGARPYFGAILSRRGIAAITPRKISRTRTHAIEVRA